jgi:hypothetical protein
MRAEQIALNSMRAVLVDFRAVKNSLVVYKPNDAHAAKVNRSAARVKSQLSRSSRLVYTVMLQTGR